MVFSLLCSVFITKVLVGPIVINLLASAGLAQENQILMAGNFSSARIGESWPEGWKPLTFEKIPVHTEYELVRDEGQVVIKATSRQSSSGLIRELAVDPKDYPIVKWRWKVENILKKGDVTQKSGDDYPARLYITFEYDSTKVGFFEKVKFEAIKLIYGQYPPIGAINYIWESTSPVGTIVPNPFTDRVRMFVIESGQQRLNQWVSEERNIVDDYRKAFGEEPPRISGIAIMTDTDNTQESAVAYFGNIVLLKKEESGKAR